MNSDRTVKLVVVDDDQANRYYKAHVLRQAGFPVLEAETGSQALQMIADERPTLALMDVKLPDISGIEVTKKVKAARPELLVLQTSAAKISEQDKADGLAGGADAYLVEPIEPEVLVATVNALLRLARAERDLRQANRQLEEMLDRRTAELRAEAEKRQAAEAALRHAEKLDALGQLTGGVAHDFNNLLTVILGGIDFVERRRLDPTVDQSRIDRYLANARQAAKDCAKLTRQLLSFARRAPAEVEVLEINDVIVELDDMMRTALGANFPVVHDLGDDVGACSLDRGQLEAAMLNLAVNARDAMPAGGEVRITTKRIQVQTPQDLGHVDIVLGDGVMPQSYVCISVRDSGTGMEPELLNHVFEPFFTTKDVGKGSGLGLSQVYGFVRQAEGFLTVTTAPHKGTTVSIVVPCAGVTQRSAPADDRAEAIARGHETILLVEDNDQVREGSVSMFSDLGYTVLEAEDGHQALGLLKSHPDIALLFTDIVMPNQMSGVELAISAKIARPGIRVLLTSGYAREAQWAESSANEFPILVKPYGQHELAQRVRQVLDTAVVA